MKKVLFFIFLISGSYALAMNIEKDFSLEEEAAIALLQIKGASQEEVSPRRSTCLVVVPNIKKQHREARIKARSKWTPEQLKSLRKVLFPEGING